MKPSGAQNRLRKMEAEQRREQETVLSPRRLSNLSPEEQEKAYRLLFYLQKGYLQDPDKPTEEEQESGEEGNR